MAVEPKKRVQMTLPAQLVKEIDEICERAHISRAVWIEYTLAMAVDSYRGLNASLAGALAAESKEV